MAAYSKLLLLQACRNSNILMKFHTKNMYLVFTPTFSSVVIRFSFGRRTLRYPMIFISIFGPWLGELLGFIHHGESAVVSALQKGTNYTSHNLSPWNWWDCTRRWSRSSHEIHGKDCTNLFPRCLYTNCHSIVQPRLKLLGEFSWAWWLTFWSFYKICFYEYQGPHIQHIQREGKTEQKFPPIFCSSCFDIIPTFLSLVIDWQFYSYDYYDHTNSVMPSSFAEPIMSTYRFARWDDWFKNCLLWLSVLSYYSWIQLQCNQ